MSEDDSIILLHASDFHVRESESEPFSRPHDARSLFIYDACEVAKDLGKPTAIILSGDIAFSGQATQYDVAREMLNSMLERLDLNEKRILLVPGNHDVDRNKALYLQARMIRDQLRYLEDNKAAELFISERERLLQPLLDYQEFAMAYDCLISGEKGYWEVDNNESSSASAYLSSQVPVVIRGISTVHVSDRNDDQMGDLVSPKDFGSHMYIARGQLSCDPINDDTPFRILVGHHPPSWWRYSEERMNLASTRFHLHLFGHEHNFLPHLVGNAVCVKAGAVNPEKYNSDTPARYNWIRITNQGNKYLVNIWSRKYDSEQERFAEDPDWPAGQGYLIEKRLNSAPILVPAEPTNKDTYRSTVKATPVASDTETHESISDDKPDGQPKAKASSHSVRYALLSQGHAAYSKVFDRLGKSPSGEQRLNLGGYEHYESVLSWLLKNDIESLIKAMEEEGIHVS